MSYIKFKQAKSILDLGSIFRSFNPLLNLYPLLHCTVAEEMINEYSRIFINRYGFKLDYIEKIYTEKEKMNICST